jgi:hypothetical protein
MERSIIAASMVAVTIATPRAAIAVEPPPRCSVDADCSSATRCKPFDGRCHIPCSTDADCDDGSFCSMLWERTCQPRSEGVISGSTNHVPSTAPPALPARGHESAIPQRRTVWYGWQTLLLDAPAFPTALVAGATESVHLALLALGWYVLAPPFVHFAHGRVGTGFGSLGVRVGMPIVGAIVGAGVGAAATGGGRCTWICEGVGSGALIGFGLGLLSAVTIDAAVLSHETSKDSASTGPSPSQIEKLRITPAFGPRREGGYDVAVGGTF